ncbi:MAG: 30S ribosomal protein S6 [Planctomycetes bacterium]|nr:30S ribosomal protein S6 [Planctomycetota bacterium]
MADKRVYNYEAMFLISQATAAELGSAIDHIKEIIARGHGEIISMKKWDDRRLAYEIKGQKRGMYILVYFKAAGTDVAHIERDCNLSEKVMRVLILRVDHMTLEEMQNLDGRKELEIEAKMRSDKTVAPAAPAAPAAETAAASA